MAASTTAEPLIYARNLVKRFGEFTAVDGIDVEVERGESFGFLGPNGAGKSSTMRMIGCVSPVTDGELRIFGLDPTTHGKQIRARIGVVPQQDQLDEQLTVVDNLVVYGRYFDLPRAECKRRAAELLDFVQLGERATSRIEPLSGGMKRRVTIARSLINDPELLLLDEPTTGLDPQARVLIWRRVLDLKRQGKTLLLTTHYMDEAQRLCDRIIVIDAGRVLDEGSPLELIARHVAGHVFEIAKPVPEGVLPEGLEREDIGDALLVYTAEPAALRDRLPADIAYTHRAANLEDVFLRLTGRRLREG